MAFHKPQLKRQFNPGRPHPFSFPLRSGGKTARQARRGVLLKAVSFNRDVKLREASRRASAKKRRRRMPIGNNPLYHTYNPHGNYRNVSILSEQTPGKVLQFIFHELRGWMQRTLSAAAAVMFSVGVAKRFVCLCGGSWKIEQVVV